ncbi:Transcriptional regulator, MerR family [Pseudomonas chlororaphis]|nr:MerR family transcriptional regulator [Pseudomonas chlororaphis]AZD10449.1 Transcriptional regulator, MerR family [Pseudomonas chlororaphis]
MNDSRLDPDASASESDAPHEQGWLPIREVTRQTGVNAVTLRAWERRYELIVPQRTAKGHRLFSNEHVQRILKILTWLDRGMAVSQVKQMQELPCN